MSLTIGQLIKQSRKQRGMNQQTLADFIGISARTLGRYENDEIIPDDETVKLLADRLRLKSEYLISLCEIQRGIDAATLQPNGNP